MNDKSQVMKNLYFRHSHNEWKSFAEEGMEVIKL